jgi:hypothetical protein
MLLFYHFYLLLIKQSFKHYLLDFKKFKSPIYHEGAFLHKRGEPMTSGRSNQPKTDPVYFYLDYRRGARGGVVVKALRYKPAGLGFDSQWCHLNFSVT